MTDSHQFTAMMIESARSALSGFAAAQLTESEEARPGDPSFDSWRTNLDRRLQELSTALAFEEPGLLAHEIRWARTAFEHRGLTPDRLRSSLECLRGALVEKLPSQVHDKAIDYLDHGIAALDDATEVPQAGLIEDGTANGQLALRYLERILRGFRPEATALITQAAEDGASLLELFESVLMPVQREIGNQWHRGELSIAEEHFCTSTTQHTITALIERSQRARQEGGTAAPERGVVAVAACTGNMHDMPLRILAGVFEESGWRVIQLGCDLPPTEVGRAAAAYSVDLVLLSATLGLHLKPVQVAVQDLRQKRPEARILVGGRIFAALPDLCDRIGADATAGSASEAIDRAEELLAGSAN